MRANASGFMESVWGRTLFTKSILGRTFILGFEGVLVNVAFVL